MGLKWAIGGISVETSFCSRQALVLKGTTPAAWRFLPSSFASNPFLLSISSNTCAARWPIYKLDVCCFMLQNIFHDLGTNNDLHACVSKNTLKWFYILLFKENVTSPHVCKFPFKAGLQDLLRRSRNTILSNFQPNLTCLFCSYSILGHTCLLCLASRQTRTR